MSHRNERPQRCPRALASLDPFLCVQGSNKTYCSHHTHHVHIHSHSLAENHYVSNLEVHPSTIPCKSGSCQCLEEAPKLDPLVAPPSSQHHLLVCPLCSPSPLALFHQGHSECTSCQGRKLRCVAAQNRFYREVLESSQMHCSWLQTACASVADYQRNGSCSICYLPQGCSMLQSFVLLSLQ